MLGMAQFKKDFGVYDPSTGSYILPTSWQSAGSGPPMAGLAFGALLSGLVGILIQATSRHSYWQIVAGRIVNSLALGVISNTVPAYQAECAPSRIRGTLVNFYQFSLGVGATLVNTANWGMHDRTDQWAYRMVIILQFIVPIVLGIGSLFIPESPRWLVGHGRDADAKVVLKWLRRGTADELVDQEVQLLVAAEEENKQHFSNSWIECFR
jgi:MFS transporter, SP family, sugar:H+ symporter